MQAIKEVMGNLRLDDIIKATGGRILCGKQSVFTGLSIDSRTIEAGELFVALRGPHFDGHDFIRDALNEGSGALINIPPAEPINSKTIIYVKNTLAALHDIARFLRRKHDIPVIGITGTNGKTTVKEIVSSIAERRYKVLKTKGNLNNHIGLPLCVANMAGDERLMVLEMGSNAPGDIRQLCEIAYPHFALLTNVGPAHLEGFGTVEMIRKTDLEILDYVRVAVVNSDDHFLMDGMKEYGGKIITYGLDRNAEVRAEDIELKPDGSCFVLVLPKSGRIKINLGIAGKFNIRNAVGAAALADELGMSPDDIKNGMESFSGVPMRHEIKSFSGALFISDVYNANPASMDEAVRELVRLKRTRTIAVLGDMLELGSFAEEAHRNLVNVLNAMNVDVLIAVGSRMTAAASAFSKRSFKAENSLDARLILMKIFEEGDTILVKGSRGMKMEKVTENLQMMERKNAL